MKACSMLAWWLAGLLVGSLMFLQTTITKPTRQPAMQSVIIVSIAVCSVLRQALPTDSFFWRQSWLDQASKLQDCGLLYAFRRCCLKEPDLANRLDWISNVCAHLHSMCLQVVPSSLFIIQALGETKDNSETADSQARTRSSYHQSQASIHPTLQPSPLSPFSTPQLFGDVICTQKHADWIHTDETWNFQFLFPCSQCCISLSTKGITATKGTKSFRFL